MVRPSVCRLSSVCLSVCLKRSCTLLRWLELSAIFLRYLVRWPSIDIQVKFYGYRARGTPPSGELNTRGVAKYNDFGPIGRYISERCKIEGKLLLMTNRKSHMGFRLVPKSVTLNDLERCNGHCQVTRTEMTQDQTFVVIWHLYGNIFASAFKQTQCRLGEVKLSSTGKIYRMVVCECIYRSAGRSHSSTVKCWCAYADMERV